MIIGLLFGVYYRELTKWFDFSGKTQLSTLHTHTLVLGMFFFLIVLLLEKISILQHINGTSDFISHTISVWESPYYLC